MAKQHAFVAFLTFFDSKTLLPRKPTRHAYFVNLTWDVCRNAVGRCQKSLWKVIKKANNSGFFTPCGIDNMIGKVTKMLTKRYFEELAFS
jgi:hypothetical protein